MNAEDVLSQLINVSRTFKTARGEHILKTPNVAYCSFEIPGLNISSRHTQRDALKRLERFAVTKEMVEGKRVLDLGCHYGAMLFQLTNFGIQSGLGFEFDTEKVDVANAISKEYGLDNVHFKCGDIDSLDFENIGKYDIVLALAIESHLKDRTRLFRMLAECTLDCCLFEGNSGCDIEKTISSFHDAGFSDVQYLGNCDDDMVPSNNRRPSFIARKSIAMRCIVTGGDKK